jgi:hypothetical protein
MKRKNKRVSNSGTRKTKKRWLQALGEQPAALIVGGRHVVAAVKLEAATLEPVVTGPWAEAQDKADIESRKAFFL